LRRHRQGIQPGAKDKDRRKKIISPHKKPPPTSNAEEAAKRYHIILTAGLEPAETDTDPLRLKWGLKVVQNQFEFTALMQIKRVVSTRKHFE
jgi:hypothetical protein